jgi:D-serine deaminase-like pyridoxal phosphate-dependent protein
MVPGMTARGLDYEAMRRLVAGERLPAALVDLDAFDRNADQLARLAPRSRIRIAAKSLRVPDLISRVLKRGAPFQGLMCQSAEEAAFLCSQGFDDLLIAYPTLLPSDVKLLGDLHASGKTVALIADSTEGVAMLGRAMNGSRRPFPVVLEMDVSPSILGFRLGARRSPVRDEARLLNLAREVRKFPGLIFKGLMVYEAFVAGVGDRNPFKKKLNPIVGLLRRASSRSIARRRKGLAELLALEGFPCELFNGGGTASLSFAAGEPWLTELTAGSAFLCPQLFDYYSNVRLEPACFFALQAVRTPELGVVTCLGGGYMASGEPGWDRVPRPWLPAGAELFASEACGEVQTPVRLPPGCSVAPGDPVFFRHAKAGELAEHFNEYLLVSDGRIVRRSKTYRGFGRSFY